MYFRIIFKDVKSSVVIVFYYLNILYLIYLFFKCVDEYFFVILNSVVINIFEYYLRFRVNDLSLVIII